MGVIWNPWHGCHRCSDGCKYCYIHKGDAKRGVDTSKVTKTAKFYAPIETKRSGEYKIKSGQQVFLCFTSDFLVEDADEWRGECWDMIKQRSDLHFIFLTKRIERLCEVLPNDWGDGYENVTIGCTIENQANADRRLDIFDKLPIKHRNIICQPMLERMDISTHLKAVELVIAGGESDRYARPLDYEWVLFLREQCVNAGVDFEFRQLGTHFIKDGKEYTIQTRDLCSQAKKADINYYKSK
ncbi:MAG: DUF5131 family protein [Oscillospiraceae bacterium]|nr:DUF5131 family protein [Oscillospiraceae bacterium]